MKKQAKPNETWVRMGDVRLVKEVHDNCIVYEQDGSSLVSARVIWDEWIKYAVKFPLAQEQQG